MTASHRFIAGVILVITGILVASNIYSLIPLYSTISDEFGIDNSAVAIGSTSFTISYAVGLLFFGPFSDRFGRKFTLILGLLFACFATVLVAFAIDSISLYVFRSIQGFTLASFAPVAFAYSFEIFTDNDRTLWIALINAGFLAAGIIGQIISSFFVIAFTWQLVYIFFSLVYGLFFFVSLFLLPKSHINVKSEKASQILKEMGRLIREKHLRKLYMIVFTLLFAFVSFYEALNYLLLDSSSENNMLLIRSVGLIGTVLSIFTGLFIKRFTAINTLFAGVLLGWLSTICLFLAESVSLMAVLSIIFVASIALLIPTIISLIGTYSGNNRGKALSLYSFILLLGASVAPLLASSVSYKTMMVILMIVFSLDLLFSILIKVQLSISTKN